MQLDRGTLRMGKKDKKRAPAADEPAENNAKRRRTDDDVKAEDASVDRDVRDVVEKKDKKENKDKKKDKKKKHRKQANEHTHELEADGSEAAVDEDAKEFVAESDDAGVFGQLRQVAALLSVDALFDSTRGKKDISGSAVEGNGASWAVDAGLVAELSLAGRAALARDVAPTGMRILSLAKLAAGRLSAFDDDASAGTQKRKSRRDGAWTLTARDVETNPALPLPRQYVEMGLWRLLAKVSGTAVRNAAECCEAAQRGGSETTAADAAAEMQRVGKKTFRDLYVAMATDAFGDDLDALRKDADFDQGKVGLLIDCLRTGIDTWGAVEQGLWLMHLGVNERR